MPQKVILRLLCCCAEPHGSHTAGLWAYGLTSGPGGARLCADRSWNWLEFGNCFFFFITHLSLSPLLPPSAFSYTLTPKGNTPNVCLLSRMQADAGERQRLVVFFLTTADEGFLSRRTTVPHQTVSLCLSVFAASCRECHFPKGKRKQKKTGHINRNDQLCDPTDLKTWAMRTQTKAFDCKHDPAQPSPQRSCQYWPTTLIRLSCHLRTEISQGC